MKTKKQKSIKTIEEKLKQKINNKDYIEISNMDDVYMHGQIGYEQYTGAIIYLDSKFYSVEYGERIVDVIIHIEDGYQVDKEIVWDDFVRYEEIEKEYAFELTGNEDEIDELINA